MIILQKFVHKDVKKELCYFVRRQERFCVKGIRFQSLKFMFDLVTSRIHFKESRKFTSFGL